MGFFKKDKPASQEVIKVVFGANYITKCNQILDAVKQGKWNGSNTMSIEFDNNLLAEIEHAIRSHSATKRILYSDDMEYLDVVGESFHQEELKDLFNEVQDSWLSGFLMPEPLNPHDQNAISVIIISPNKDDKGEFKVIQVGHLKKEQAKKVSKKIIEFAFKDTYIPVLAKLNGGTSDKPNIGILARAKTNKIRFS